MAKRNKSPKKPWTANEVKKLKQMFRNRSTPDVAKALERSVPSVKSKAFELGLTKTKKYLKSIGKA